KWYRDNQLISQERRVTAEISGHYRVQVINQYGCTAQDSVFIAYSPPFRARIIAPDSILVNTAVSFLVESQARITQWEWNLGDGTRKNEQAPTHIYRKAGLVPIFVIISNGICADTLKTKIFVKENCNTLGLRADFSFSPDTLDLEYGATVQLIDKSQKALYWEWKVGDGRIFKEREPRITFSDTGLFLILLQVHHLNCKDSISKFIKVKHSRPANTDIQSPNRRFFALYPNPTHEGFYLQTTHPTYMPLYIEIIDNKGRKVHQTYVNLNQNQYIKLPPLEEGIYYIRLKGKDLVHTIQILLFKP
ncbi:MAG: PKD domain-containing protein, partial [Bacteroidia bacterium]|nr:PKD domain-containing protein [Bacteroidia bacterium]